METTMTTTCVVCGMTENEVPLLSLQFKENPLAICPQCLPALIHAPAKLAAKIPGLENISPAPGSPRHEH
jgi:hypothetical protein